MRFPFRHLESLEDAQQNFEFLQASRLYWGNGAPTIVPPSSQTSPGAFYFRLDKPTVANQRIYVWSGTAWTGIL